MAKFEIEVQDWQAEVFRKHVGAFLNAQITTDELAIAEIKAHKLQTWQARLDLLKEPIPEELLNPVRMAYGRLFSAALSYKKDLVLHVESLEQLNLLQSTVYQLFEENRDRKRNRSWLTSQSGAVIIESFGLKTGQPRKYTDLAPDLLMSPERTRQLAGQAVASLRRPFLSPLFVPQLVTFRD